MKDAWERARQIAEQHAASGSLFVRLVNDGDKVEGVFLGEPHVREVHWDGDGYVECTGKELCDACEGGKRPSLRASINMFVLTDKAVKIFEGSLSWFKDLVRCREKYGLDKWAYEIQRRGAAGSTKTHYALLPHEQLTEAQHEKLLTLELHDLVRVTAGQGADEDTSPRGGGTAKEDPNKKIALDVAEELMASLKRLPAATVQKFLKTFSIARIRDLSARSEEAAFAFIHSHAPAAAAEVDPFA